MEVNKNNLPNILDIPSKKIKDLTGKEFGRLKVLGYIGQDKNFKSLWLCQCSCENHTFKISVGTELAKGNIKSCGCLVSVENKRRSTHGMSKTRIYTIYKGMIERCYNKNGRDYIHWGGRGIKICDNWYNKENGFVNFYNWAISNGYQDNLSIDRICSNKNYEPTNCRWVTMEVQNGNKTTACQITYEGTTYNLLDFYNNTKPLVSYNTFKQRVMMHNWDIDDAINIPTTLSKEKYYFLQSLKHELETNKKHYISKRDFIKEYNINENNFNVWINQKETREILDNFNYLYLLEPILVVNQS